MTFAYRMVMLPGLLCDHAAWHAQVSALRGRAECTVAEYGTLDSLPAMADAVLVQAPSRFVLAGHSMGGRVALEAYRRAPDRVQALALLDTGFQARPQAAAGNRERADRMELVDLARRSGMRTMGQQWVRRMVHPDRLDDASLMGAILDMIERTTADVFEAQQRALLDRPDATRLLSRIDCPTLLLCGREDAWSPVAQHQDMAERIAGSDLAIVERCGHMSTMERPDAVNEALGKWLAAKVSST